jgi:glycosyltransferase involved in cell wall biosynthesis
MHVGINLLFLVPGEVGGSEPLLVNLVEAMASSGHEMTVFAVKGFGSAHPAIREAMQVVEAPWATGAQGLRVAAEHSWLAVEARRRKLGVIHHGGGTAPFVKVAPTVVTVHDIQFHHHPENFVKLKRVWLRLNVPRAVQRAEVVTVPSEWVRQDLAASLRADLSRVVVVPFGSENLFGAAPATAAQARERYRLDGPFFLFPGRTYPHKNHRMLVEAFAPLAEQAQLVFTGAPWFRDDEVAAAARHLGLTGRVRHLGLVPRGDLAGLYRAATALVYPTRFEGFGAPVLEAMSAGCPVIASNATAVPEVVGDAGILLDPDDLEGWTGSMQKLIEDSDLRALLAEKGKARAAEFSWEKSARLQLSAYEQAAGR